MQNPPTFTIQGLAGNTVSLKPDGADTPITYDTRLEYADLIVQYRLHEFDACIDAIAAGMGCMIPMRVLAVFTGAELEEMVCGSTVIDTENLKKFTIYEGCTVTDPHIQYVPC